MFYSAPKVFTLCPVSFVYYLPGIYLAASTAGSVHLTGGAEPVRLRSERVTTDYFSLLGVWPELGRPFSAQDAGTRTVVLSHNTWENFFGKDARIVGKSVQVNGEPHIVIGVTGPPFFGFLEKTGLWLPIKDPLPTDSRETRDLIVIGRLNGVTREAAQIETRLIASQLAAENPKTNSEWSVEVTGVIPLDPQEKIVISLLLVVVFLVLAIACANIANLLLARAVGRRREIAVRTALGAGGVRIVQQFLVESVLYALLGGALGLALTIWSVDLVRRTSSSPFLQAITVDQRVLTFTAVAALLSTLLFGLTPALHMLKTNLTDALKSGARLAGDRGNRLRTALMIGEVAGATLLLIVAGLILRTTLNYRAVPLGFRVDNVLTLRVEIPAYKYAAGARVSETHEAFLRAVGELPEVRSAGAGSRIPAAGSHNNRTLQLTIADRPAVTESEKDWAGDLTVTSGFFEALEIPLLRGRLFAATDTASAPGVAIISQIMATKYWGANDPVGRQLRIDNQDPPSDWITVIGVVADVRNEAVGVPPDPLLYLPLSQHPLREMTYLVSTRQDAFAEAAAVRSAIWKVDPAQPVFDIRTMRRVMYDDFAGTYLVTALMGAFGVVALAVAAFGIFGVFSHAVSQRRAEMGIRLALGAIPNQLVAMVVRRALRLCAIGIAVGLIAGWAAGIAISGVLFKVSALDPVTFLATAAGLAAVGALACYLPARHAARVDPITALRHE